MIPHSASTNEKGFVMKFRRHSFIADVALVSILAGGLAACGNGSSGNGNGGASNTGGATSSLQITGAATAALTGPLSCTTSADEIRGDLSQTVNGTLYLIQVDVTHFKGPGSYTTDTTDGSPSVSVNNEQANGLWNSQYSNQPTTIVVNADGKSGTVSGPLVNNDTKTTSNISGTWACG
jgi:hypothetical protein